MRDPGLERSDPRRRRRHRTRAPHRHFTAVRFELGPGSRRARARRRGSDRRRPRRSCGPISTASRRQPATSTRSMPRARRNMRCSPRCWRARPTPSCSTRLARLARRCDAARRRACRARAKPPARPRSSASSASISICSSGSAAASCCPTARTISPASCTSARWRGCATILRRSASSAPKAIRAGGSRRDAVRDHGRPASAAACRRRTGTDQQIFEKHLAPWIGRFFADLERAEAANFYRRVGTLGRVFMDIETEAFALPS